MKLTKTLMATTALTLAAGVANAEGHMANEMTIVSWGGAYSSSQQNAYHDPYSEKTGVKIINDESSAEAVAKLRAMNEAGNVTWDVVDVVASDAMRLCDEGLALEIDHDDVLPAAPDGTSASDDFGDLIVSDCFIPQIVFSTTFGYRTDQVPAGVEPPKGACDVFDQATYPGKRALNRNPIANMEWALLCDGVAYEDVYDLLETDEGQAQAFAKLDTIKDDTVWWTSAAEAVQLLADGEVFMGSTYNGRLFAAIEEQGQPIGMMWDAQVFDLDGWIVPAGLPEDRLARVMDFLYFATDTQRLADQAKYISYGPARKSSGAMVGLYSDGKTEMAPHMPTAAKNLENALVNNFEFWVDMDAELNERFNAWLAQ